MKRQPVNLSLLALLLILSISGASASILDQEYWMDNPGATSISNDGGIMAQTFTAGDYPALLGQTTALLASAEFYVRGMAGNGSFIDFEIREVVSEAGDSIVFGSTLGGLYGYEISDFALNSLWFGDQAVVLEAYQVYALVAITAGDFFMWDVDWLSDSETGYTGGQLWRGLDGSGLSRDFGNIGPHADTLFRIYVSGNQIPEPAPLLLFGLGLLGISGLARRQGP